MSLVNQWAERLKPESLERTLGLKPRYPSVAITVSRGRLDLLRMAAGRGKRTVEAIRSRELEEGVMPTSLFEATPLRVEVLQEELKALFEQSGTKPGKVSLILPDNLAKISLISLPERPATTKQLEELIQAQVRRSVPFRWDEARLTYQVLPTDGRGVVVLVVLMRKLIVEQFEQALEAMGIRVGLVDLSTPNVINLFRDRIDQLAEGEKDLAILNSAPNYFALAILRKGALIFYRCKSYAMTDGESVGPNGTLAREVSNSFAYYREKLDGEGVGTLCVRTVGATFEEIEAKLAAVEVDSIEAIRPEQQLQTGPGVHLSAEDAQRLAPAFGATIGRR